MKKNAILCAALLGVTTGIYAEEAKTEKEGTLHGSVGTKIESEHFSRSDNVNEGKVKFTFGEVNLRHDNLPGWDFGGYSGREELFSGSLLSAEYDRGVNSIQEIYLNRSYSIEGGNLGWGLKLAGESIDKRVKPEVKVFGSYNLNKVVEVHGYALYHVQFKKQTGHFDYYELEPGFGFKIADNMGAWLNFRYQTGTWNPKTGFANNEKEAEVIIKPGMWYGFNDKLSGFVFAEIGKFKKKNVATGAHLWKDDYVKLGGGMGYNITKNMRIFGEVSYKDSDIKDGNHKSLKGKLPFGMLGMNYSF